MLEYIYITATLVRRTSLCCGALSKHNDFISTTRHLLNVFMWLILIMMKVTHLNDIASKFMNQNNSTLNSVRVLHAFSEIGKMSHKLRTWQKN